MIPKYAFHVEVTTRNRSLQDATLQDRRTHNFESLDAAYAYSATQIRKPGVVRVRVLVVLSDYTNSHGDSPASDRG